MILDSFPFQIDVDLLLDSFRLEKTSEAGRQLANLAEQAAILGRPKILYRQIPIVEKGRDYVVVEEGLTLSSSLVRSNLADADCIYPYLLTCGTELAAWAESFEDMLDVFWADKIMETALKAASTALVKHLESNHCLKEASNMNPGSLPDWPLSQQKELFEILGAANKIGVHLTSGYLMVPLKSVSGIYFSSKTQFVSCRLCTRGNCPDRRVAYQPNTA